MKLTLTLPTFDPDKDDVSGRELVTILDGTETNRENIDNNPANLTYVVDGLSQGQDTRVELRNFDDGAPPNFSTNPSVFQGKANVSGAADTTAPGDPGAMTGTFTE